ncbi:MAG: PEGA domain-containing protein, partial [Clostridia bacterium]|nr:PEGA domain-containing protein [Clostridia bacterium]
TNTDNAYWNTVAESDPIAMTLPAGKVTLRVTGAYSVPQFDALIFKAAGFEISLDSDLSYAESEAPLSFIDVYNGDITMDEFLESMTNIDLIKLAGGSAGAVSRSAASFGRLVEYEIPQVTVSDGGAGLRLEPDIGATCLPCATLLACTWNTELIREMGRVAGRDGMSTNSDGWLAPGMNIHRNPLCGRNFEYYSEDPLVTGISAAMVILGAKDEGVNAVPKHFALNNKENGRTVSDSRISERAMREIYLEGYRIMFEMTDHKYLMSSYNKINGVEVAENYDILTGILRDEWGFDGIVMTDWANDSNNLKEVKAGNNLKMPKGDINAFVDALSDGSITRSDLKLNAKSILNAVLASNSMANAANYTKVSAEKSVVIHAKDFNFIQDNHTGINANGYYVQAQSWNFIVNTMDKTDVYAPLTSDIESDGVDYPDTSIFADYYIEVLDDGEYALDLLVCNDYSTGVVDVELDGELVGSVETKESDIARTHTETLVLALEAGKHKIRLSRNDASASDPVKLNRVVVSPYLGAELEAQAYINGNITVVDSTGVECEYPCNCSASITLLEGGSAKAVIREYDAIPVSTENGNTVLNYSLGVPAGTYTVRVEKPGYTAAECEITVSDGVDLATVPMLTLKREDCTSGVTCTECGRGSTAADDHSFEFVYNNDYHYLECAHCSAVSGEKSAHEPDENGKCTVCTYDASNADNAIFSVNVSTNGNGMVSYDDTDPAESFTAEVEASSNITLTAVTNEGFPFKGWYIKNGAKISDNLSITFAVLGDISLEAKFAPSYVIFTPETGLSGNNARNNHVIATKVSARGTLPSYINFNVPAAETAEDLSRFEIELDTNYYPEGYSSSTYPYMKICYRTSEYTSSEEINIATPSGARAWGGENFALNNNGSFNTVVYDLAKTSTGEDNWSDGNDSLIKEAPIFANNFTENKLSQIILRAAGKQGSTLTIGDLDIAYVAFFASKTEAEEFEIPRDVIYGDVNNDGSVDPVDVTHLARYMANWNGYENIDAKNSDIDESGSVTTIDNVILSRHIANWLGYDILPIK